MSKDQPIQENSDVIYIVKGSQLGGDPAVSFYWNDWSGGTSTISRHLKGCYIDLLVAQFNNGCLTIDEIKTVLASDFGNSWPSLQKKFRKVSHSDSSVKVFNLDVSTGKITKFDFYGMDIYVNMRLNFEVLKRKKFSKSRRDNLSSGGDSSPHMGNENGIEIRKQKFIKDLEPFVEKYGKDMVNAFYRHWSQINPSGKKMLFETKQAFELPKRLATWRKNDENFEKPNKENGKVLKFPDEYNAAFLQTLKEGSQISQYYQHLHSKGLVPKKNHRNEIIDFVPAQNLQANA